MGSRSYGTATPTSDFDYMSVVIPDENCLFGLTQWGSVGTKDEVYEDPTKGLVECRLYDIRKFVSMCSGMNPNAIPLLWIQPEHYEVMTPEGAMLVQARNIFNSKKVFHTFSNYAKGQLQKMGGVFNDLEEPNKLLKAGHLRFQEWATETIRQQREMRDHGKLSLVPALDFERKKDYDEGYLNAIIALNSHSKEEAKRIKDGPITGRMGAKRKELREQYGFDCYEDATTEFLTDRGWLKWDDVLSTDALATINIQTMNTEFQLYTERHEKIYSGPMYTFNGSNYRAVVTANHHMLVSPAHRNSYNNFDRSYNEQMADWRLVPVSQLLGDNRSIWNEGNCHRPRTNFHYRRATNFRSELSEFAQNTPDWELRLRLAGFYLSDGCAVFRNGLLHNIRFTQSKFGNDFQTFLDELSILPEFEANHLNRYFYGKEHIWDLVGPLAKWLVEMFGHTKTKHVAPFLLKSSQSELDVFWEGLIAGDGSRYEKHDVYYTSSKLLADSIQATFVSAGYVIGVSGPYNFETAFDGPDGPCPMYQVRKSVFQDKHGVMITSRNEQVKQANVKDVRVVCFSMPNGTLITRNKGKVAIHGNTKFAFHTIRLMRMCVEFLTHPEEGLKVYRKDIDGDFLYSIRTGAVSQEDIKKMADELFVQAKEALPKSPLPDEPDHKAVNRLCREIIWSVLK